jgi:hypothetical protein
MLSNAQDMHIGEDLSDQNNFALASVRVAHIRVPDRRSSILLGL